MKTDEDSGPNGQRPKDLIESLPEPVFETDTEGRLTFANPALLDLLGYGPEDVEKGISLLDTIVPEDRDRALRNIREVITGGGLPRAECKGRKKDGSRFSMILFSRVIREGGEVKGLRGILVETGERKEVEEVLRGSEEARRLAQEKEFLAEVSRIITSSFDIGEVYERFAGEVGKLIRFDWLAVNLVDFAKKVVTVPYVVGGRIPGRMAEDCFPLEGSATEEVAVGRTSLLGMRGNQGEIQARFPGLVPVYEAGFSSFMMVPLVSKDRGIGALCFGRGQPDAYGEDDLRLAESIANQIAGAVSNFLLFSELRATEEALRKREEEARRLAEEKAIVAEIGRVISSAVDINEVYERFSEEVRKLIPFHRVTVNLIEAEHGTCRMAYVSGLPVPGHGHDEAVDLSGTATELIIRSREGLLFHPKDEAEVMARFPGLLTTFAAGFRSIMGVPLVYKDQVIGALHFRSTRSNAYRENDLRMAESIASQIAGAIANALLYAEHRKVEQTLRETNARLRALVQAIPDIVYFKDCLGRNLIVNRAFENLAGMSADAVVGRTDGEIFPPELAEACRWSDTRAIETRGMVRFEEINALPDGSRQIFESVKVPIFDEEGNIRGLVGVSREITERKAAEEALRKSEEAARRLARENESVAEIGRIIGSTLDIDEIYGRFAEEVRKLVPFDRININLNDKEKEEVVVAYEAGGVVPGRPVGGRIPMAGSAAAEVTRSRVGLIYHPANREAVVGQFPGLLHAFDAGYRSMLVVPLISKDRVIGSIFFGRSREDAYTEEDRRIAGNIASQIAGAIENAQLYAEHKRVEESLRESEEKYRQLFDEAPVGYHDLDLEGRLIRINRTELSLLGYSGEEMLGRPVWDFILEKELSREATLAKLVSGRILDHPFERTYLRKDGKPICVLIKEHPLKDSQGRLMGIRSILQDITERKRADEERLVLQEQLRHSQKMEAVGQLAGGVAHDFNNLLTVIQGNCELSLFDLHEGDPLKGNIEEIKKASERATGLTRQLLAFSRRQVLESKVLDLNGVLRDLEKMLRRVIGEDVALETGLAENLWRVKTDPGQIEQVIINLAVNARDAMPTGGKLIIETANVELDEDFGQSHIGMEPGRYVQLSVSDTGVGMTPEVRERIFDPFFTTKEKGKGTGLGLSTVYGIVKQSGGSIWVYSETGLGSTFKIYLPRADEDRVGAEARGEEREIPRGRETVLLVEDEGAVRRIAAEFLRKQGYTVLEAHQGGDALLICRRTESVIHLMVTDVVMPGMSGRELAENLVPLKPEMRILYMSGYTDNAIVHHGVLEPGVNFLQKPFTLNDLARKVRDVLDEG